MKFSQTTQEKKRNITNEYEVSTYQHKYERKSFVLESVYGLDTMILVNEGQEIDRRKN